MFHRLAEAISEKETENVQVKFWWIPRELNTEAVGLATAAAKETALKHRLHLQQCLQDQMNHMPTDQLQRLLDQLKSGRNRGGDQVCQVRQPMEIAVEAQPTPKYTGSALFQGYDVS